MVHRWGVITGSVTAAVNFLQRWLSDERSRVGRVEEVAGRKNRTVNVVPLVHYEAVEICVMVRCAGGHLLRIRRVTTLVPSQRRCERGA